MRKDRTGSSSWGVLVDGVVDHPKFMALRRLDTLKPVERLAAVGLWAKANGYAARYATDGALDRGVIPELAGLPPVLAYRLADALVEAKGPSGCGLWERSGDGDYQIHDYTDWNITRAEREELSRQKAEAGRRGGRRSWQARAQAGASSSAEPRAQASASASASAGAEPSTVQKKYPPTPLEARASNSSPPAALIRSRWPVEMFNTGCDWPPGTCVSSAWIAAHPGEPYPAVDARGTPKQCEQHRGTA